VSSLENIYPAHIRIDQGAKRIQTCTQHSRNTAKHAADALKPLGLENAAYLAGLLHDCGKFKSQYADYLEQAVAGRSVHRGSVVHTFAGVRYLLEHHHAKAGELTCADVCCELLAYAIGAHHGLFDCRNEHHESGFQRRLCKVQEGDDEAISQFIAQCASKEELDALFGKAEQELSSLLKGCIELGESYDERMFLSGLLCRLLTSSVMEGDRRDTAEFMNDAVFPPTADEKLWLQLLQRGEKKLSHFPCDTSISRARRTISDACRAAAAQPPGLYRLNVPTGGGKTLSSLRYALAHAAQHGKKRIIFTSPLLSILDQNSHVIRDMLEEDALVLEHHSNVLMEEASSEELARQELLTDSWAAPIIITTLVQLLNTMFDGKTSCVRRFHALSDAVIVIDEVQTVPHKLLTLFHLTISFLSRLCGTTVLLCSATQPCDTAVDHPIRAEVGELIPYNAELWEVFRRTELKNAGRLQLEEIPALADRILSDADSLLIICNKKSEAIKLFKQLADRDYELFHLSASMCMAHRETVLKQIYASLRAGSRKTLCVSTQVIEAGVDISFDAVIRLTAGLDSIVQAAGRCNRSGESETPRPVFIVQALDEDLSKLTEIQWAKQATQELLENYEKAPEKFGCDLSSARAVDFYYKKLFDIYPKHYHDGPLYGKPSLYKLLSCNADWRPERKETLPFCFAQAFAAAGAAFSVFDNKTTDVIVPYGDGVNVIADLQSERAKYDGRYLHDCIERAKGYTISLYEYQRHSLGKTQALIPLADGMMFALAAEYYNEKFGLNQEVNDTCSTPIL